MSVVPTSRDPELEVTQERVKLSKIHSEELASRSDDLKATGEISGSQPGGRRRKLVRLQDLMCSTEIKHPLVPTGYIRVLRRSV